MWVYMDFTVTDCHKCQDLVSNRSQIVDGVGPMDADIVLVGEAPGENEDENGEPFVGRSGQILNDMLEESGINREDIRITNAVRCRPPDNRDPTEQECSNCSVHLSNELDLIDPDYVIALGATAFDSLTGVDDISVLSDLGDKKPCQFEGIESDIIACPHPAALIYRPSYKDDVINLFESLS